MIRYLTMKTYRTLSNQFEMTIERKPIKKYLNILSIPGNAKASTYILKNQKKKIILKNLYLADSLGSYVKHFFLPGQLILKMIYELAASMMLASKNVCKPGAFCCRYHFTKMAEVVPESVARI